MHLSPAVMLFECPVISESSFNVQRQCKTAFLVYNW